MLDNKKRFVIIGATSAIAEHCVRLWVANKAIDVTLVGRDEGKLNRIAADLRVRSSGSSINVILADFSTPHAIRELVDGIISKGVVHTVLIAHGSLPDQASCEIDLAACADALGINAISPVLFAEAFAGHMQRANHGTLALIGSVAGDRGRKSNYVYGAAKGLVTRYAQGLQHRLAATAVKVVLIKPGPTRTPMTAHMVDRVDRMAPVEQVAAVITRGIKAGKRVIYAPGKWQVIMMVIRHLPHFIFAKMDI